MLVLCCCAHPPRPLIPAVGPNACVLGGTCVPAHTSRRSVCVCVSHTPTLIIRLHARRRRTQRIMSPRAACSVSGTLSARTEPGWRQGARAASFMPNARIQRGKALKPRTLYDRRANRLLRKSWTDLGAVPNRVCLSSSLACSCSVVVAQATLGPDGRRRERPRLTRAKLRA